jgi:hypothetical protein
MSDFLKSLKVTVEDLIMYVIPGVMLLIFLEGFQSCSLLKFSSVLSGAGLGTASLPMKMVLYAAAGFFVGVLITPISAITDRYLSAELDRDNWPSLKISKDLIDSTARRLSEKFNFPNMQGESLFDWLFLFLNEQNREDAYRINIELAKDAMLRNAAFVTTAMSALSLISDQPDAALGFLLVSPVIWYVCWFRQMKHTTMEAIRCAAYILHKAPRKQENRR